VTELYLKAATEAELNAALIEAGLVDEQVIQIQIGEDDDGNPVIEDATVLVPAPGVCLDVIGPITRMTGVDEDGEPVTTTYPEHHVNVLCNALSEEALALIEPFVIVPPETPYRVWAR
jgi:hypothetical protein